MEEQQGQAQQGGGGEQKIGRFVVRSYKDDKTHGYSIKGMSTLPEVLYDRVIATWKVFINNFLPGVLRI